MDNDANSVGRDLCLEEGHQLFVSNDFTTFQDRENHLISFRNDKYVCTIQEVNGA